MSDAMLDSMKLHPESSEAKGFDLLWEPDEKLLVEHYGISSIKKSSGIMCLMCMKFFHDEMAAEEHAKNLLHYQRYYVALHESGKNGGDSHIVGTFCESEYSYEEESLNTYYTKEEIEENINNNELFTIRKCYGIICSVCRQFFVNEVNAGLHVKSLAHYRKCYASLKKDATPKAREKEENFIPGGCRGNSFCMEIEPNESLQPIVILQNGNKPNFLDALYDMKHTQMKTQIAEPESLEEGEIKDEDSEESGVDSVPSMDNDWWHDFDETLETLLHDIHNDN